MAMLKDDEERWASLERIKRASQGNAVRPEHVMTPGGLYYLGSPYSHPNEIIRSRRVQMALMSVIELSLEGFHVYSPIIHNHPIVCNGGPESSWGLGSFYQEHDYKILDRCDGLIVLKLLEWEDSVGLTDEINRCRRRGMNIWYRDPPDVNKFTGMTSDIFNNQLLGSLQD